MGAGAGDDLGHRWLSGRRGLELVVEGAVDLHVVNVAVHHYGATLIGEERPHRQDVGLDPVVGERRNVPVADDARWMGGREKTAHVGVLRTRRPESARPTGGPAA